MVSCRFLLIALHVASTCLTGSLVLKAHPFAWVAGLMLATELVRSAVPTLADAVVVSATTDRHQYGRCRLWGAVAWGGIGTISGLVIEKLGFSAVFGIYVSMSLAGTYDFLVNVTLNVCRCGGLC
jgi:hypothetical protein